MSFRPSSLLPLVAVLAACSGTPSGNNGTGTGGGSGSAGQPSSGGSGGSGAGKGGSGGSGVGGAGGVGGSTGGTAGSSGSGGTAGSSGGVGGTAGAGAATGGGGTGGGAGASATGGMGGTTGGTGGIAGSGAAAGSGGVAGSSGSAGASGAAGSAGTGGGSGLHGGASGKFICTGGTTYGNPLTGMGSVTTIGPPTMGTPNYFAFIEGPVWIGSLGKLFFSDNVSPERIWVLTPGGTPSVFQEKTNSNGIGLDNDDKLIIADQEMNRITRLDPSSMSAMQMNIGAAGCKPNDLVMRSDGNIYYTAPNGTGTGFYRMASGGMTTGPRTDVSSPNGIELSPDENTLYVGDVNNKKITSFPVAADGSIGATGTPFATTMNDTADGMCVDCAGNLYVGTSGGIEVYSSTGTMIGTVPTGESSNCTFGGTDRTTIFVTSRSQLKSVKLSVPGLPD